jgi:hypothetical protein
VRLGMPATARGTTRFWRPNSTQKPTAAQETVDTVGMQISLAARAAPQGMLPRSLVACSLGSCVCRRRKIARSFTIRGTFPSEPSSLTRSLPWSTVSPFLTRTFEFDDDFSGEFAAVVAFGALPAPAVGVRT